MTEQETRILNELNRRETLMMPVPNDTKLASIAGCALGTVGNILSVMENKGMICRSQKGQRRVVK